MGSCPECSRGRKIPTQRRRLSRLTGLQGFGMLAPPRQDGMHWKGIPLCQGPRHRQDAGPGLFLSTRTTPARRSVGSGRVPRFRIGIHVGRRQGASGRTAAHAAAFRSGWVRWRSRPDSLRIRYARASKMVRVSDSGLATTVRSLGARCRRRSNRRERAVPTPDCDCAAGPGAPATTPMRIADAAAGSHLGWAAACRHAAVLGEACPADDPWPPGRLQRGR